MKKQIQNVYKLRLDGETLRHLQRLPRASLAHVHGGIRGTDGCSVGQDMCTAPH